MPYEFPAGHAGMIVLTFCDHDRNQFVDLAAFGFKTRTEFEAAWASIPAAPGETAFLADRHERDGFTDNREVTAEWIERRTGRPIAALIQEGRSEVERWVAEVRARYCAAE